MSSQVDVCLLADYTGSMGTFLTAAKKSMRELVPTFSICNSIDRVCILGYGDYSDKHITKWSGWKNADDTAELMQFVDSLAPEGGGDEPEAVKTGLKELMDNIDKPTIVIMLTDAPPHTKFTDSKPSHIEAEKNALGDNFDWCVLSRKLAAVGASVWTILSSSDNHTRVVYAYLSKMTKGKTLLLRKRPESNAIGRTIIGSVFAQFGHDYNFEEVEECVLSEFDEQSVSHEGDLYRLKHAVCEVAMPKVDDAAKKAVVHCFRTDPAYKQRVYNVFKTIITEDMIMSLSYNPLLGTLWREICTDKKNDTRFALMNILSSTIGSMEGKDKVHMQAIIEQSYNREWEIREIIESVGKEALYPALAYIGPALNMTVKDVLALGRSCDARSLKILGSIMQSMIVVDHPIKEDDDEATAIRSLPLALQTEDLFSCISALIVHGLMQSKRGAAVMAMLAVYTKNQLLYEKASQFLIQARGTWLDVECPENFSYEFVKFVRRVQDIMEKQGNQLLTDKEKSLLEGTYIIGGWRINGNTRILVETAYSSKKTYRYDWKKVCSTCTQYRSMTLLNEKGICGLCIADGVARARQTLCKDPNKSYMCECSKCQVHYAVELVEALNVVPKCHFCRHSEIAPTIQCVRCTNKFVNCEQENVPNTAWQCAECHHGSAANDAIPVPIKEIITTESLKTIMNAKSIWAIYDEMMNKNIVIPEAEYIYVWNKKPILNRDTVINSLDEWIRKGKSEWGTCLSCLTDLPKQKLQPMCKRRKCDANVCSDCIAMWYGGVKRGCVVNVANLKCAFCRQAPHVSVLNKHNKELCAVHNLPKEWKYDWHYAWCRKCDNIRPCFERNCARDTNWDPESIKNFTCEDCDTIGNDAEIVMKECPKCKVSTVKAYGCNHMECPCGAHWCFECGDQFDEESIYNHMWEEHKTIGLVAGDEEDDYDNR